MTDTPPPANASPRQFVVNVVSSYANLIVGLILGIVVTRVLLGHLGASTYGLWVVLFTLVSYLGLLDAGVSTAAVQRVARLSAVGDTRALADLLRTASVFFSVSGFVAVAATVVVAPFLASFIKLEHVHESVAGPTLVILGVMMAVKFVASVPDAMLFGSGRSDRQAQIGLATLSLTQIAQVVVVLAGGGLIGLAVVTAAGSLFGFVLSWAMVRRLHDGGVNRGRFDRAVLGDLLRFGGRNMIVAIGGTISFALDTVIIGVLLPVAQVAPYDVALSTANLTRNLTTQGTNLLLPTYAHLESREGTGQQGRIFQRSVLGGLVIALPVLIALAAFGQDLLHLWLGTVPPRTYSIMIALGLVIALQLPGQQCFVLLTGIGRNQVLVRLALISAAVNFVGSVIATYLLGPIGPAIGSLPVVLLIDFTFLPIVVCRYLGVPLHRYVGQALLPALPVVAVAGLIAVGLKVGLPKAASASVLSAGIRAALFASVTVAGSWVAALVVLQRLEPGLLAGVRRRIPGVGRTR